MAMKLILGALFIFMLDKTNYVKADVIDEFGSTMSGKYDGEIPANISKISPVHVGMRSRRQSGMELNSCRSCGLANIKKKIRTSIIKGDAVQPPNKYPWMVAIKKFAVVTFEPFCAGAIISEYYILTAAHCLVNRRNYPRIEYLKPNGVRVAFSTSTYEFRDGPPVQDVIPHPQYPLYEREQHRKTHDIALLKLKEKIICDRFKTPICLPPSNFTLPEDAVLTISGRGTDTADNSGIQMLKEAKVKLEDMLGRCPNAHILNKGVFYCLKGLRRQSACHGDSGGPAFYNHENNFYVIGVASQSYCDPELPFLYTSVPSHLSWILENMR